MGGGRTIPTYFISDSTQSAALTIQATNTSNVATWGIYIDEGGTAYGNMVNFVGRGGVDIDATNTTYLYSLRLRNTNILAAQGEININTGDKAIFGPANDPNYPLNIGAMPGSPITTSSADIKMYFERFDYPNYTTFTTTGTLSVESHLASFGTTQVFPDTLTSISPSISGYRFGKPGNTATINSNRAFDIAGPVEFYGGVVNVNNHISTNSTSGTIRVDARNTANIVGNLIVRNQGDIRLGSLYHVVTNGGNLYTTGGNIYLAADQTSSLSGHIDIGAGTKFNSRSSTGSETVISGGGEIVCGG
jgi:hypothetical protein